MDLLRELKAMPVTLHLLQVGPSCPCSEQLWDSAWPLQGSLAPVLGQHKHLPKETIPAFFCCSETGRDRATHLPSH